MLKPCSRLRLPIKSLVRGEYGKNDDVVDDGVDDDSLLVDVKFDVVVAVDVGVWFIVVLALLLLDVDGGGMV